MDDLASWTDGPAKAAILDFVDRVTAPGGRDHVLPADRVAVFDNDGTLWCERPAYAQALFLIDQLRDQVAAHPEIAAQPVVHALLAGDLAAAKEFGLGPLFEVLFRIHEGMTTEEFTAVATEWFELARHPRFGTGFGELAYLPMLELLELLHANEFRVFIVTGGGVEFVRAISERIYGVARDDVVGSAVQVAFERRDGRAVLVRQAALRGSPNDGPPKVQNIQAHIGRRPILAAGNTAGDREMLEYAHTGSGPSLCIAVSHDDGDREYAYPGTGEGSSGAEPLEDTAAREGWTLISMRDDWSRVFRDTDAPADEAAEGRREHVRR
jgi:phosphoglycolate phosphatase-like HAD superfamily hydrolase